MLHFSFGFFNCFVLFRYTKFVCISEEIGKFQMGLLFSLTVLLFLLLMVCLSMKTIVSLDVNVVEGSVNVNGTASIGYIDEDFICATLDWWPPEKCDYGSCSWGNASLLNLVSFIYCYENIIS